MAIFVSKKRRREIRAEIRERKRKREETKEQNDKCLKKVEKYTTTENSENIDVQFNSSGNLSTMAKRSQPEEQQTQSHEVKDIGTIVNGKLIVRIPPALDVAEIKRFRKNVRRKARKRNKNTDMDITFVQDGDPIPYNAKDIESPDPLPIRKALKMKKRPHCINDLLKAEKLGVLTKKNKKDALDLSTEEKAQYVAIDCEMVGVGNGGIRSALARASVVDYDGSVLLDVYVKVPERVTDYRTHVSGIRSRDINAFSDAITLVECRRQVATLIHQKKLIGHAVHNDLQALSIDHPVSDIRDTSKFPDFMRPLGPDGGKLRPRRLKDLAEEYLGINIQTDGEAHDSVQDASAAMELYKSVRLKWERYIRKINSKNK